MLDCSANMLDWLGYSLVMVPSANTSVMWASNCVRSVCMSAMLVNIWCYSVSRSTCWANSVDLWPSNWSQWDCIDWPVNAAVSWANKVAMLVNTSAKPASTVANRAYIVVNRVSHRTMVMAANKLVKWVNI